MDIESYYDSKDYTLKKMSCVEYCRDKRFKFHGLGYAFDDQPVQWISHSQIANFFSRTADGIDWSLVDVVSHNAKFDWFAIQTYYDVKPRSYIDTKGMSRAVLGKSIKNHSLATLAEHFGLQSKGVMQTDGLVDLTQEQEAELAEYCLHDVALCREIYKHLAKEFPENQYKYLDQTVKMFVKPKLQLNVPLLEKANEKEKKRRENIFKEIKIGKAEFASNKKFPELLRSKGYEIPYKTSPRTGKEIPALALGDTGFLEL